MTKISTVARERIEAQGFCGLDDNLLAILNYPLRLAPAMCMTWTLVGIVLGSPAVIGALVPFAILGAVLPGHPFDVIYNFGLRHLLKTPALPRYGKRRRLACVAASTALSVSAMSLQVGISPLGYVLAGMVVAGTLLNVSTGICPPAAIAGVIFGRVDCTQGVR
jgi:hypothetical protein